MPNHLIQSGGILGLSLSVDLRRNASTNPDSLIPSRMAALTSEYMTQKTRTEVTSGSSSAKNPNPAIDISNSPEVAAEPTSHVVCTPPAENDDARRVPLAVDSGLGVCTLPWAVSSKSNLDSSGVRLVRKGVSVRFRGGCTARVSRVRMGVFWTTTGAALGSDCFHHCCVVEVV